MNVLPLPAPSFAVAPAAPVRPAQPPAGRPAAAVLQRNASFGQLSLDLRRSR